MSFALALGIGRSEPSFPQIFADLIDPSGAAFSNLALFGLEVSHRAFAFFGRWDVIFSYRCVNLADAFIDLLSGTYLHLRRDMAVDIKCGCG